MKLIRKIRNQVENKKGETSLVFVFSMIFIFWLIMFIIDLFRLTYIHLDATSVTREVMEVVSAQGGVSTEVPDQYPSQSTYVTSDKLAKLVHDTMLDVGIDRGDIVLMEAGPNGQNVTLDENTNIMIDYGNPVIVRLRYSMNFISLPDKSTKNNIILNVTRNGRSKYKHRTSEQWEGEGL